jgi:hypothetical protein
MTRSTTLVLAALTLALVAVTPARAADPKSFPADHPFLLLLADAAVERGREHRALLVVPIARSGPLAPPENVMTSAEALRDKHLSVGEPDNKEGRTTLELFNWSTDRVLLLAGETLVGGYRDRFLGRDVLLGPGRKVQVPVYYADAHMRKRDERKTSLVPLDVLAPAYPRYVTVFSGSAAPAVKYVENGFALTGDQHDRKPYAALLASAKLTARIEEYRKLFAKIPDEAEGSVVGVAAWVGDRLTGIDLFPANGDFRRHWPKILHALAFQASLYEIANGLAKHPFPAGRDPDRHKAELKGLLKKPFAARIYRRKGADLGMEYRLRRELLSGRVLMEGDTVVHALLMTMVGASPSDPRRGTGTSTELTYEELLRKASRSRLTEFEKRLLERLQQRRRDLRTPNTPPRPDTPVVPPPPREDD